MQHKVWGTIMDRDLLIKLLLLIHIFLYLRKAAFCPMSCSEGFDSLTILAGTYLP
jgi:hypothetical protein